MFYSENRNWWALSRFGDVRAAATDPQTFLSYEGIDIDDTAKDQSGPGFLPDIDNPRHDQRERRGRPEVPGPEQRRVRHAHGFSLPRGEAGDHHPGRGTVPPAVTTR